MEKMSIDEAIKRLEIAKITYCTGCMHPQAYRYCEEICRIQEAFDVLLNELKKEKK